MEPLVNWDEAYLMAEVVPAEESDVFERKSSDMFELSGAGKPTSSTKEELAKQISAFSNAGQGFLTYGITNDKALDAGVPLTIGTQPTKEWVDGVIPQLVFPPVTQVTAKVIQISGRHDAGHGVLVLSVPLSERRPHWAVTGGKEIAYIRAGAHSLPMRPQTMLDIASRGSASEAEILLPRATIPSQITGNTAHYHFVPRVRLINGPLCERWAIDLHVERNTGKLFVPGGIHAEYFDDLSAYVIGNGPLFPGRITDAFSPPCVVEAILDKPFKLTIALFAGSAQRAERAFGVSDLDKAVQQLNGTD